MWVKENGKSEKVGCKKEKEMMKMQPVKDRWSFEKRKTGQLLICWSRRWKLMEN